MSVLRWRDHVGVALKRSVGVALKRSVVTLHCWCCPGELYLLVLLWRNVLVLLWRNLLMLH